MTITIAYLYYDLLNLYGESGNIKALKWQLEKQEIDVKIKFLTIDDILHFNDYDLIYIGAGTEENQKIALKHLSQYKQEIKQAVEEGKFFLITGNSIELFGKGIIDHEKKKYRGLGVFHYQVKQEEFRMIDEAVCQADFIPGYILGFQNQYTTLKENKYPMFQVIKGIGSYPNSKTEGIHYKNFYGTYLIGPLLVRNPEFLKYFIKELVHFKDPTFKLKKFSLNLENKAHQTFIDNYYKDLEKIETP